MAKRLACWLLSPMSTTPLSARRKAGSYGLLLLLDRKLGNSQTASPERDARMPACGREGGGGIVADCLAVIVKACRCCSCLAHQSPRRPLCLFSARRNAAAL